jgi:aminoglycoside phosphotransferase (APT) family kinase protein
MSPEARLAALPLWRGKPEIRRIEAGRTNHNYLVEYEGRRFFARIGMDIPQHGISRIAEKRCAALAAAAGISPEVLYAENGVMVIAYVEGETLDLSAAHRPDLMAEIGDLLRRLHEIPAQAGLPVFCPVAVSRRYLAALPDDALPRPRARIAAALDRLPSPAPRCLVHGDLIPENFIRTPSGMQLIDWEYAGNGVPETDLALVLSNFGLAGDGAEAFLAAFGTADRKLIADLRITAIIREALWCLTQVRLGGNVGDLPRYTALCLQRLDKVLT